MWRLEARSSSLGLVPFLLSKQKVDPLCLLGLELWSLGPWVSPYSPLIMLYRRTRVSYSREDFCFSNYSMIVLWKVKVQDVLWRFMQSLITTSHWKETTGKKIAFPPYAHNPIAQLICRVSPRVCDQEAGPLDRILEKIT